MNHLEEEAASAYDDGDDSATSLKNRVAAIIDYFGEPDERNANGTHLIWSYKQIMDAADHTKRAQELGATLTQERGGKFNTVLTIRRDFDAKD